LRNFRNFRADGTLANDVGLLAFRTGRGLLLLGGVTHKVVTLALQLRELVELA
jgi:hypothetical protein